jgi:alpha-1,6-mannosyltransferase
VDDPVALPLGVDVETFRPDGADPQGLRRRLGLTSRHRLLVFAGRPAREKRVDVLVEAVERLGDPYVLLLVGARATTPSPGRVIELPYEREPAKLAALLASCDAFVHANDSEPFGLIVLEAMACGLPVVGVDSGGVAESVDESVGALAWRSAGPEFAAAIEGLFDGDVHARGRAAMERARERHGWDAVFQRLSRIYAEVSGEAAFARPAPDYALASNFASSATPSARPFRQLCTSARVASAPTFGTLSAFQATILAQTGSMKALPRTDGPFGVLKWKPRSSEMKSCR